MVSRLKPVSDKVQIAGSTVAELLRNNKIRIPRYQRYYKWRDQRWSQLWGDLVEHLRVQEIRPSEYHLGDMRFEQCADGTLEVADGQQRLVSLAILVAALGRCAADVGIRWDPSEYLFVEEDTVNGLVRVPRIADQMAQWTSEFARVIGAPLPEDAGELPFGRAYRFFVASIENLLAEAAPEDRKRLLEDLLEVVLQRTVVTKAVYSNGLGQQSFARVHTRGEPVSSAEILKAELMGLAGPGADADMVWECWRTAVEIFENERRGLAMWVAADLSDSPAPVRDSEAAGIVRQAAREARDSGVGVASVVKKFATFAEAWKNLQSGRTPDGKRPLPPARNIVEQTALRAQKQLFWLLTAGRALSPVEYETFARAVENTVLVATVVSPFPPDVEALVARVLHESRGATTIHVGPGAAALGELKAFRDKYAQEFANILVYGCQHEVRPKALESVLRYIEAHADAVSNSKLRGDVNLTATLEHVLPQRLTDDVLEEYGDHTAALRDRFRLGNLALVNRNENAELSNKTYGLKKPIYGAVPFRVTSSLAHDLSKRPGAQGRLGKYLPQFDEWSPSAVQQRSESLYSLACDVCDVRPVDPVPVPSDRYEPLDVPQADDPDAILATLLALVHVNVIADVAAYLGYSDRQGSYYLGACAVLGLAASDGGSWSLTAEGREVAVAADPAAQLRQSMQSHPYLVNWQGLDEVARTELMQAAGLATSTARRRSSTLDRWVNWAFSS